MTRFGETFWETKKNHANEAENAMVRLAFYKSLRDAGVKGEAMQTIMHSLGITVDDETQMATVTENVGLSRYEIKQLLTTADNYNR